MNDRIEKALDTVEGFLADTLKFLFEQSKKRPKFTTLLVLVFLFVLPFLIVPPLADFLDNKKDALELLVKTTGGVAVLLGAFLAWKRIEVAQQGQITERFTRAIDQLGSEKREIRLGGIYALERIAKDSPGDHWSIMEILTAYVRENSRWTKEQKLELDDKKVPPIAEDIQAVLTVISRRKNLEHETEDMIIDLSGADLRKAVITGAILFNAKLSNTHLEFSDINASDLRNSTFWKAHLVGATLKGTNLNGARFHKTHLEGAQFIGSTNLSKQQIESAIIDFNTILPDYLVSDYEWYETQLNLCERFIHKA